MSGPFAFLRRLFGRDEPLTESERYAVRAFLYFVRTGAIQAEADVGPHNEQGARLALRHGYADDGTAGLPFYRVTPKGERFLQEFER